MGNWFSDHEQKLRVPVSIKQAEKFNNEIDKFVKAFYGLKEFHKDIDQTWTKTLNQFVNTSKDMKIYFRSIITVQKTIENNKCHPGLQKGLQETFRTYLDVYDGTLREKPGDTSSGLHKQREPYNHDEVPHDVLQAEIQDLHDKIKYRRKQLDDMEETTVTLRKQLNDASIRLSEEMNAKVGADERNLENISILNRPIKIAEEYESVSVNAWLDAKACLDDHIKEMSEHKKLELLSKLWLVSADVAKEKYNDMTRRIYAMISIHAETGAVSNKKNLKGIVSAQSNNDPVTDKPDIKDGTSEELKQMPQAVKIAINDFLRTTSESIDISAVFEEITVQLNKILSELVPTEIKDKRMQFANLIQYLQVCGRIGWKMAAQRPPMNFDNTTGVGQPWREKDYEVYYTSENPMDHANVVLFYVNPALMHDKTVMSKGRVFVGKK